MRTGRSTALVRGAFRFFRRRSKGRLAGILAVVAMRWSTGDDMSDRFRDRYEAGRQLSTRLLGYAGRPGLVVLGLPRGGVPVAAEIASALNAPLDVLLVRKLGVPGREELALGAIASGGLRVLNDDVIDSLNIAESTINRIEVEEQRELVRRERIYRGLRPAPNVRARTVILVDDGLATGATMKIAALALRRIEPAALIGAAPVAAQSVCRELSDILDEMICLKTPDSFYAVGLWYEDFEPTSDDEVQQLLQTAWTRADDAALH